MRLDRSANLDDRLNRSTCNPSIIWRSEKGGPDQPADNALGRSRGGLKTKIHMLCDVNGTPLRFLRSGGQASDIS